MQAPVATETEDAIALAKAIRASIHPMWRFTHIASGEKRDKRTAAILKAMGVERGFPDYIFFGPDARVFLLELKRRVGGRETVEQQTLRLHLMSLGFTDYLVTNSVADAILQLNAAGIIRARVSA